MWFVMYGSIALSSVLLSLREVKWVCMMCQCSCLCLFLEVVMKIASFHVSGMMLLFSDMLYMLKMYAGDICESK